MPSPRNFLVVDALTLTAATAFGIAGTRHVWSRWGEPWFWNLADGWSVSATFRRLWIAIALLLPGLAAWTAAVLALRLVAPRPPLRRIALQPGAAACGVALMVLTAEIVGGAASLMAFEASRGYLGHTWRLSGFASWVHTRVLLTGLGPIGFAVLAAWAVLWLSRRVRPEPSWVDRTGRALGACWVAAALAFWLSHNFLHWTLPGALT